MRVDDDRPGDKVVPEEFLENWDASSVDEALRKAAQAPTTTPAEERPRCPVCGTLRVSPRPTDTSDGPPQQHDGAYVCRERHYFSDPVYGDPDDLELREADDTEAEDGDEDEEELVEATEAKTETKSETETETDTDTDEDAVKHTDTDSKTDTDDDEEDREEHTEDRVARRLATLDHDVLVALAIYCHRPWGHTDQDPSYEEIAESLPYSRGWVGQRVREWKDGKHRDKVADPRPQFAAGGGGEAE